jgi:ribosome-associated heat shock protein Hsp15
LQRFPELFVDTHSPTRFRIDKWLWAARFFKTRSLACDELAKNRISVNGQPAKASREVRLNDRIELRQGDITRTVIVKSLSDVRGPAPVAQALYEETAESVVRREQAARNRHLTADPSQNLENGRPTKRDRRKLVDWNRWSASYEG